MDKLYEDNAIKTLEEMQIEHYQYYNIQPPRTIEDLARIGGNEFMKIVEHSFGGYYSTMTESEFVEQAKNDFANATDGFSRYEDIMSIGILKPLIGELKKALLKCKFPIPDKYIIGTLFTRQVNGMAMSIDNNPYKLILLESGLFVFVNAISKIFASTFSYCQNVTLNNIEFVFDFHSCKNNIDINPAISQRLYDILHAYVILGNPAKAERFLLQKEYWSITDDLRFGMEAFVLAHEFGHLIEGHLEKAELCDYKIGRKLLPKYLLNWQMEYEADRIGSTILGQVMKEAGHPLHFNYWSIEVFFACIDMVEKFISILINNSPYTLTHSDTHPSTITRRDQIENYLLESYGENEGRQIFEINQIIRATSSYLWTKIEGNVYKLRESDIAPNPIWFE